MCVGAGEYRIQRERKRDFAFVAIVLFQIEVVLIPDMVLIDHFYQNTCI